MIKTDTVRQLHNRVCTASQLLKVSKSSDERIALANYIGNVYLAIRTVTGEDIKSNPKKAFRNKKEYLKFLKKIDIYEDQMLEHFVTDMEFHSNYFNDIMFEIEQNLADIGYMEEIDYTLLSEDEFYTIFYDFMSSLGLGELFNKFIKEKRIYSSMKGKNDSTLGFTLFNPINKDTDVFVGNFENSIQSMFTLAHEFGHVYDLYGFSEDVSSYNRYFYQSFNGESISKLFERLFVTYLIKNNILLDEAKDKLFEMEVINHDYLLGSYVLSLLDKEFIRNGAYALLDKNEIVELVKDNFISAEAIGAYIINSTYFDVGEDFNYAYGDIISMFLHEAVMSSGFDNELLNNFFEVRSEMFNRNFFDKWNMSSDRYTELHRRELQLLKK